MIDLRYVKKLVELLDSSTVDSIEISSDKGMKLRISKTPAQRGTVQVAAPMSMPAMLPAQSAARTSGEVAAVESTAAPKAAPVAALLEVKSPMVGTFYGRPEPTAKPYVSVGQRIEKGQTVCIIEAMKIMNEIESEFSGVVREVMMQDAQPVEFGQVLFRIDPNG
jgi:acetyl-CoA carboxylase biotin carboxyl carrier protein